jgi:glycosyltransferase involved in cell wall biosynthesis
MTGTPAVVSAAAGVTEHLGPEQGVVPVAPEEAALAEALIRAIDGLDALRARAWEGRELVLTEYTWEACAERWLHGASTVGIERMTSGGIRA